VNNFLPQDFVIEASVNPDRDRKPQDFEKLPTYTKDMAEWSLPELVRDGPQIKF
jgi:hypothetical protein